MAESCTLANFGCSLERTQCFGHVPGYPIRFCEHPKIQRFPLGNSDVATNARGLIEVTLGDIFAAAKTLKLREGIATR